MRERNAGRRISPRAGIVRAAMPQWRRHRRNGMCPVLRDVNATAVDEPGDSAHRTNAPCTGAFGEASAAVGGGVRAETVGAGLATSKCSTVCIANECAGGQVVNERTRCGTNHRSRWSNPTVVRDVQPYRASTRPPCSTRNSLLETAFEPALRFLRRAGAGHRAQIAESHRRAVGVGDAHARYASAGLAVAHEQRFAAAAEYPLV